MIPFITHAYYFIDYEQPGKHDEELIRYILEESEINVFIAIIKDTKDPVLSPEEHTNWKWCDFKTAYEMVDWAVEKKQHRLIHEFISQLDFNS